MKPAVSESEMHLRAQFDFARAERGKFHERFKKGQRITLLEGESDENDPLAQDKVDPQLIEVAGKHLLISRLIAAGLEVAEPIRDKGVDLIAYSGRGDFVARPIQLKASSNESFSLAAKYSSLSHLLITYVWNVQTPERSEVYAMSFKQAEEILKSKKYDQTDSWQEKGYYFVRSAGAELKELLKPYRISTSQNLLDRFQAAG
jgi:hypothetical protein